MGLAKGTSSILSYKEETTFNVLPAAAAFNGLTFSSERFGLNINKIQSGEIRSDRKVPSIRGGNFATNGGFACDLGPERFGKIWKHLLGSEVGPANETTSVLSANTAYVRGQYVSDSTRLYLCVLGGTSHATTPSLTSTSGQEIDGTAIFEYIGLLSTQLKKHVYQIGSLPAVGLTFEKQIRGQATPLVLLYPGSRIGSLGLNIPQEGIVQADFGIASMRQVDNAGTALSTSTPYVVDDPFTGGDAFIQFDSGSGYTSVPRPVREGSLNVTNSLDENIYTWGSRSRRDIVDDRMEVSCSITTYFEDRTEFDYWINETPVSVILSFNRQGKFFKITMGGMKITGNGVPTVGGPGVMNASFNLDAFAPVSGQYCEFYINSQLATLP